MKNVLCFALLLASIASCKTPQGGSNLQSSGAFDTSTGRACLVWIKDQDVYYKHCAMQNDCEPTDGRIVMTEANYIAKLYEQFGVSTQKSKENAAIIADLEAKYKNFLSIQSELEKIRKSNPDIYAEEMQKAEDRAFGTRLSLEEAQAHQATFAKRQANADKILGNVRSTQTKKMSVILIPEIAAALTPIFGPDISNCFEPSKAPQVVASVAVQKEAQAEWDLYNSWAKNYKSPLPICTRVVPGKGFEELMKDWYEFRFSNGVSLSYPSLAECNLARNSSVNGVFCYWSTTGSNFRRTNDGKNVGHNPDFALVVKEGGKDIFPDSRSLKQCIADLSAASALVGDFPGFMAVPKYNIKAERLGSSFEIVSIWNNRTILDNVSLNVNVPLSSSVTSKIQTSRPAQPNTTQIFAGQSPSGTSNGSAVIKNNTAATMPTTNNTGTANSNSGGNSNQNTNSSPQVQRLVAALKAVKSAFSYVDAGTRDACLSATMTASEPWSDLMAHYYCHFPVQDNQNAYSVRACFTGSLRGVAPYQKAQGRQAAFSACIIRPEFAWLKADQERSTVFELIMAQGPNNITISDQNKAITEFYGSNPVPVR